MAMHVHVWCYHRITIHVVQHVDKTEQKDQQDLNLLQGFLFGITDDLQEQNDANILNRYHQ